ncbi:MAG TPA: sigma-54 dependent transcriptional regulator [Termitinemataceae bacterium]|nr:sigma-54 dependent transcriptional regulator [Termitinemataceae bacterium]HPQ01665.1 sigma-54 dependent transcriptional regulator [Termitinemataceae bacterium]
MDRVVYVDEKKEAIQELSFALQDTYEVIPCINPRETISIIRKHNPKAVLLEIVIRGYSGFQVLEDLQRLPHPLPAMVISEHTDPLFVVRALKTGAQDYLSRPYTISMLNYRLKRLITCSSPKISDTALGWRGRSIFASRIPSLVGESPAISQVRELVRFYADSHYPVLIQGESGTGKDLVARMLHFSSYRAHGPYEVRNVGAIPLSLLESELFGCEVGAFTDARQRKGCFELAHNGTLFLDEIGNASDSLQAALLRVIEDGEVRRLGGSSSVFVNTRLVCATNKDLGELVKRGRFRDDLRYRIAHLVISLPPLRKRKEDIPLLVEYFLRNSAFPDAGISSKALSFLQDYHWPGNVRQLRACLERALLLCQGTHIEVGHISFE